MRPAGARKGARGRWRGPEAPRLRPAQRSGKGSRLGRGNGPLPAGRGHPKSGQAAWLSRPRPISTPEPSGDPPAPHPAAGAGGRAGGRCGLFAAAGAGRREREPEPETTPQRVGRAWPAGGADVRGLSGGGTRLPSALSRPRRPRSPRRGSGLRACLSVCLCPSVRLCRPLGPSVPGQGHVGARRPPCAFLSSARARSPEEPPLRGLAAGPLLDLAENQAGPGLEGTSLAGPGQWKGRASRKANKEVAQEVNVGPQTGSPFRSLAVRRTSGACAQVNKSLGPVL